MAIETSTNPVTSAVSFETDRIFVPIGERGLLLSEFRLSVRLTNVLDRAGLKLSGDLQGRRYDELMQLPNCGKKTIGELQEIVRLLQVGSSEIPSPLEPSPSQRTVRISRALCDVAIAELPLSVRLENVMRTRRYKRLGDLDGLNPDDLLNVENCGRKSIAELEALLRRAEAGEFTAPPATDFSTSLVTITRSIDIGMEKLGARDRKIVEERLSGNEGEPRTLEEVGNEFGMTRERVRQIVKGAFTKIRRAGGPALARAIEMVSTECEALVLPLTPTLLAERLAGTPNGSSIDALFHTRVLDHMTPSIPAWPPGTSRESADDPRTKAVHEAVESWLRANGDRPTTSETFKYLRAQPSFASLLVGAFLAILRRARRVIVDFPRPDEARLRLRRLRLFDVVLPVLNESAEPLTPEEIIDRARARFGAKAVLISGRTAENALAAHPEIFRLGPRAFGLRKHFASSERERIRLRGGFETLLRRGERPISSIEVFDKQSVELPAGVNSYELAEILRGDDRFIDLGRRLFSLTEWGVEEREHVKDLLPRIFAQADRPMTVSEIYERLTKFRSATLTGLSNVMRNHPEIQSLGFDHYGLRSWGDSRTAFLVSKRTIVERAVRRAEPPIRFATLCENFGIPCGDPAADILWKSCASSPKLRRAPDRQSPDTLLMHKAVSLEQALASVSRALAKPTRAYELEWELQARYGELFAGVRLKQIEERLAKSTRFLVNGDGAFFLDVDLDLDEFDGDALCAAATTALAEAHEILSCNELIERLELQGFDLEELSPGMLASILRACEALQEVGHQRFRSR